jgi:hypothetical protein
MVGIVLRGISQYFPRIKGYPAGGGINPKHSKIANEWKTVISNIYIWFLSIVVEDLLSQPLPYVEPSNASYSRYFPPPSLSDSSSSQPYPVSTTYNTKQHNLFLDFQPPDIN